MRKWLRSKVQEWRFWWEKEKWRGRQPMVPLGHRISTMEEYERFALARALWLAEEPKKAEVGAG